jgi:hypothetical protein
VSHLRAPKNLVKKCDLFVGFEFAVSVKFETAVFLVVIIYVLVGDTEVSEDLFYTEDRNSKF